MTKAEDTSSQPRSDRCPEAAALAAVFEGRGSPETRTRVLSHLEACEECCDRFAALQPLVPSPDAVPIGDGALLGDRYRLRERIGSGQWGEVWLATDERLRRAVAVKLLLPARLLNPDDHARVAREAETLAQLDHPNIVGVYDHGVHDGRPYLVMEYVEGTPLAEHLRSAPRTAAHVVPLFVQAAQGLAAAHLAAVVRRDFKPDNVLVDATGRVRVTDFGLASSAMFQDYDASEPAASTRDASQLDLRLTPTDAVLGTPAYMAPELWRGTLASPRSDQFALCAAFAEALLGSPLLSRADLVTGALSVDELQRRLRGVPAWLRPVLVRGLHPEPGARHRDLEQLVHAIYRRSRRRRVRRGVAVTAVLATAVGLAAFGLRRHRVDACIAAATAPISPIADREASEVSSAVATMREALQDYRDQRLDQVGHVCRATHGQPGRAEPELRARHFCLEEARVTEAVVSRVMLADSQVVTGWHLLGRLPPLDACLRPDERAIASYDRFAEGGVQRQERLIAQLAREHVDDIRPALQELISGDDVPPALRADVHIALAAQWANREDLPAAESSLRKGLGIAIASANHRASLAALLALVRMAGSDDARAGLLLQLAEPLAEAVDAVPTYLHARARHHVQMHRLDEATADIDAALAQLDETGGPLERLRRRYAQVRMQGTKAEIARLRGDHDAALLAARIHASEQRALGGEDAVYARALAQLGGYAQRAGQPAEAEASFRQAAERFEALGETELSLRARVELARQLVDLARWEDAIVQLRTSMAIARRTGGLRAIVAGATFLAYIHESRDETAAWTEVCREATAAATALHGPGHVRTLETEAFCTDGTGDDAPGRRRLTRLAHDVAASLPQLSAHDAITARGVLARVHTRLAGAALERDDLDEAEQHAREVVAIRARSTDDKVEDHTAELMLAQILARRGETTRARDAVDEVLAEVLGDGDPDEPQRAIQVAEQLEQAAQVFRWIPGAQTRAQRLATDADRRFSAAGLSRRAPALGTKRAP